MKICPRCSELQSDEASACPKDGAELREVRDPMIGRTVGGRYRLISRLGSGGMSAVYLARHVTIDRLVAVKTLRRDLGRDAVQRDRFIREARAVNRINHENIVDVTDFGETEDGLAYLVMEYVPGESLLKRLSDAPFPASAVLQVAEQIAHALGRAHQMGVVHRDLKPENVLLVSRRGMFDQVKILDFGIAKILDAPALTGSQQIFGTPGYIAPEYIQSTNIDGRSDLYSLGVIMYEMSTAALPFDYQFPGDLLVKHVTEPPIPPRTRHPDIAPALEAFILRALAKDPAERFRDAYHFLDELGRVRDRVEESSASWADLTETTSEPPEPSEPSVVLRRSIEVTGEVAIEPLEERVTDPGPPPEMPRTPLKDTSLDLPRPPFITSTYDRPSLEDTGSRRAPPTPIDPSVDGLLGVERWRRRYDALADVVARDRAQAAPPGDVEEALADAGDALVRLEAGVPEAQRLQRELEELAETARDARATLGRAIDEVARRLSQIRGGFEAVVHRRNELRGLHEVAVVRVRCGDAREGEADALLWELAAVEEELRVQAQSCDELELQLTELSAELESDNERFEATYAESVRTLDHEMGRLEAIAAQLRDPLDRVEDWVLDQRAGSS